MNDAVLVRVLKCFGDPESDLQSTPLFVWSFRVDDAMEVLPVDKLHDEVVELATPADVEYSYDVRMVELRDELPFAQKPLDDLLTRGKLSLKDLDRDGRAHLDVVTAVDGPHPAVGDFRVQLVGTDNVSEFRTKHCPILQGVWAQDETARAKKIEIEAALKLHISLVGRLSVTRRTRKVRGIYGIDG